MKMQNLPCAYCGRTDSRRHKGHVIGQSLYIDGIPGTVQGRTVPECEVCKVIWTDAETLFRNVVACASDGQPAVRQLWKNTILPSFDLPSGPKWFRELQKGIKQVVIDGEQRHKIYPEHYDDVMLVVRKIVRGLSAYHEIASCVADDRVHAFVLRWSIPEEFREQMEWRHMGRHFFEYGFDVPPENDDYEYESAWYLKFYGRCEFVAVVLSHDRE